MQDVLELGPEDYPYNFCTEDGLTKVRIALDGTKFSFSSQTCNWRFEYEMGDDTDAVPREHTTYYSGQEDGFWPDGACFDGEGDGGFD